MNENELREQIINGLAACFPETEEDAEIGCEGCPYGCCKADAVSVPMTMLEDIRALLKAQQARVMTLDLPPSEWEDKVIWLEIKGKKPIPCLFRKCCDRMMFGRYERIMSFDAIGSSKEGGYFLRNYGVNWRCWTSRPTVEQREAVKWE